MIGATGTVETDNDPHAADALLHYAKALTGQFYYIPSLSQLYSLSSK